MSDRHPSFEPENFRPDYEVGGDVHLAVVNPKTGRLGDHVTMAILLATLCGKGWGSKLGRPRRTLRYHFVTCPRCLARMNDLDAKETTS